MQEANRKRSGDRSHPSATCMVARADTKKRRLGSCLDTILLLNDLGIKCHRDGKSTEANILFRESLSCMISDGDASLLLGKSKTNQTGLPPPTITTQRSTSLGVKESEYDEGMHIYRSPLTIQQDACQEHAVATLRYNLGLTLIQMKDFEGARFCFLKALEAVLVKPVDISDSLLSTSDTLDRLKIHHNLGYCYYRNGHRKEAMHFYLQTMFLVKGEDHQGKFDLAVACNCVAMLHLRENNCNSSDCLELLRTSLTNLCSTVGPVSLEAATVLFNIGQAHFYRADYVQALTSFQEALSIRKDVLGGEESIDVAICIFGIGQSYHKLGQLDEAMTYFTKFLEIRELHGLLDHHDVITALNSIAILHKDKGEVDKAYVVFEKALVVGVAAFGGCHPNLASTLISFGSLCFQMGKFETALKLYEECLRAQKEGLGPSHPDVIHTLLSIAQIHWHVGRYRSAWITFKEILTLQVQSIGPTSLPVASTVSSMALIYCQMEKYDDALELYQEALRIRRDCFEDQDNQDITATLNTIGLVLCKLHEFKLAKEAFQECLRSRTQTLGANHLDVSMLMHNLAAVHLDLGEEEEAVTLLNRALHIRRENLGQNHPEVASTLHHLGQAYQIRGTLEEAAECFQQGLDIERNNGSKDKIVIRKLLNLIGNIHLMRAQVKEMMECFVEASRLGDEANQQSDFRASLLVTGHNFYDLSSLHPQCAPVA